MSMVLSRLPPGHGLSGLVHHPALQSAAASSAATYDPAHAAAITLVGMCVSGAGGALWLRHLEGALGPTDGAAGALRKASCDYLCWAPMANTATLLLVPLLAGHGLDAAVANMQTNLPSIMALELAIFGPYNLLAFSMVPPHPRPGLKAVCSLVFSCALSLAC